MNAASPESSPHGAKVTSAADRLADLQLAFNLYPASYAHPSWLARLGITDTDENLRDSPLWTRAVSSTLLRTERLDQHFDCDFFDPAKRLALLDAATLTRIAGFASATLLRERLKKAVRPEEVRAIQQCLGADAHAFAVRWGGLLPMVDPIVAGAWPSRDAWEQASVRQLFTVLPAHAIGVIGRMRMRFAWDWALGRQRLVEPQRVSLTRLIVAVTMQCAPQWRWLFEASAPGDV